MKKTVIIIVILTLLAIATPASAKKKESVGTSISLFSGPTSFPAGEAFHIAHGWVGVSVDGSVLGLYDFELEIDDVLREEDFITRSFQGGRPSTLTFLWVYNFPDGMIGTHKFTGYWFLPCQEAVDNDLYPGPCPTPSAKVKVFSQTAMVSFP